MEPFSVYGCWDNSRERWGNVFEAETARGAEDLAQLAALEKTGRLWVCRVVPGEIGGADRYTAFVDPQDPRNLDRTDLEPDTPLVGADPEWTVFGIAVLPGCSDADVPSKGERWGDVINAVSAGSAEDVARARMSEQGGELWVCCVLPERVAAADTYAAFVDPDVRPAW